MKARFGIIAAQIRRPFLSDFACLALLDYPTVKRT